MSASRVLHFEIHASNPEALIEYYTKLFRWDFQAYGPPGSYWLITTGDDDQPGINGGLVPRRGAVPVEGAAVNAYVCTVGVSSVRELVDSAVMHGGTIALPVMAIPGVGWLAYVKDPDGNIFGLMQNDPSAA